MPGQFVPRGLMDRVQIADSPHGRGCQNMSDTDNTYATARPSAMGDLRFAGTIAAGLVAGTLGLGALAAPLVGWKDWPSGLQKDASTQTVRLATPQQQSRGTQPNRGHGGDGQTPGGATPLTAIGLPGGISAGTGTGTGAIAVLIGSGTQAPAKAV